MSDLDRHVAGMTCREVLNELSDALDGLLDNARLAQIRDHLEGCHTCERFGTGFTDLMAQVRAAFESPAAIDRAVARRLRARLADIRRGEGPAPTQG